MFQAKPENRISYYKKDSYSTTDYTTEYDQAYRVLVSLFSIIVDGGVWSFWPAQMWFPLVYGVMTGWLPPANSQGYLGTRWHQQA